MADVDYWAESPLTRAQLTLFAPTLDAMIAPDDPVRLVDEVLASVDWTPWVAQYPHRRGQPPIHPRWVAAAILYGLLRGIRSTRGWEEACGYRIDFMWLLSGRRIDHTTFSKFRTKFREPLKSLFRQLGDIAMRLGLVRLGEVAFDGTRVRANNARYATRTAKKLAERLAFLDELFEKMMAECDAADAQQTALPGHDSPTQLPPELAELEQRREKIRAAHAQAEAADAARKKQGTNPDKNPAQIPITDPESRVMSNKEGGYAPNYTPTATTDGHRGFIVDCDVSNEVNEAPLLIESVDRVEETFGARPEKMLTDSGNNHGYIQQAMEDRGVEFYAPAESCQPQPGDVAYREDPRQPVPEEQWSDLPRNSQKQLDKSCFSYDAQQDRYYCPQGQVLEFEKTKPEERVGIRVTLRIYRCAACADCPLAAACVSSLSSGGRTIMRDEYAEVRERTAARMKTEAGQAIYNQRPRIAETPFAILKSIMGLRRFLLRGLEKVKTEWRWACTAFNLGKLMRQLARLRSELDNLAAES